VFTLKILIAFAEQIDWLKDDLTKSLPHIKSSHRAEALARALGFRTYATLHAVDWLRNGAIIAEINWAAFSDYLEDKGFSVTAKPLYLAIGRSSIQFILGMRDYQYLRHQIYAERSKQGLGNIISDSSVEEYLRAYSLVSKIPHTRTITKKRGLIDLRQLVEKVSFTYPDGEVSPPSYVPAGTVVLASLGAGFWFRPLLVANLEDIHFNMLQSAMDRLDNEIRGNT